MSSWNQGVGPDRLERLKEEFINELEAASEPISTSRLVKNTSAEDIDEANFVLRQMIDKGMVTSTPGFQYKLASRARRDD